MCMPTTPKNWISFKPEFLTDLMKIPW